MITFLKGYLEVPEDEAVKSYEFLVSHMPDNMIVDDAVIKSAMEFAASALKLKPDAVPDISKVRDWSYARAATKSTRREVTGALSTYENSCCLRHRSVSA